MSHVFFLRAVFSHFPIHPPTHHVSVANPNPNPTQYPVNMLSLPKDLAPPPKKNSLLRNSRNQPDSIDEKK